MISPLTGAVSTVAASTASKSQSSSSGQSDSQSADVVDISADAYRQLLEAKAKGTAVSAPEEPTPPRSKSMASWSQSMRLKEGSYTLENGHKQTVTIEGNKLEILEYDKGRLVKSVRGEISGSSISIDTEFFDESGDVSQTIHTDFRQLQEENGRTVSKVSREVKWFDGERVTAEMLDHFNLKTLNAEEYAKKQMKNISMVLDEASTWVSQDILLNKKGITHEEHMLNYFAEMNEYDNLGSLRRNLVLEQKGRYEQQSNRAYNKTEGMDPRTTWETKHEAEFSLEIKDYDKDGKLMKNTRLLDYQQGQADSNGGEQKLSLDVSWYNKGELIKTNHGDMTMKGNKNHGVQRRPQLLELLDLTADEYLGPDPQSSRDLNSKRIMKAASDADRFLTSLKDHVGDGDYVPVSGNEHDDGPTQPFSLSWTEELYQDGQMILRKKDEESALEQYSRGLQFRKGYGLTEDDRVGVLRKSSHEVEQYEDGRLVKQQSIEAREHIKVTTGKPDQLLTSTTIRQGVGGNATEESGQVRGKLSDIDHKSHAASQSMAASTKMAYRDLLDSIGNINGSDFPTHDDRRVSLVFPSQ